MTGAEVAEAAEERVDTVAVAAAAVQLKVLAADKADTADKGRVKVDMADKDRNKVAEVKLKVVTADRADTADRDRVKAVKAVPNSAAEAQPPSVDSISRVLVPVSLKAVDSKRGGKRPDAELYKPLGGVKAPNSRVKEAEDLVFAQDGSLGMGKMKLTSSHPARPGYGENSKGVTLFANYVELISPPKSLILYRYDVSYSPEVKGKKRAQVVRLLLESDQLAGFTRDIVSDFSSTLLSSTKLPEDNWTIRVTYLAEGEDTPLDDAPVYKVTLQFTNALGMSPLLDYLSSTTSPVPYANKEQMLQALNIFLKYHARRSGDLVTIGSNKVFSISPIMEEPSLGAGLIVIRGFFSSVRAATARLLVNVNVSHGAFYSAVPLKDLVTKYRKRYNSLLSLNKFLQRLRLITNHLPERRNKAGNVIPPRPKTVLGLASPNDGHGSAHPPRVQRRYAGPKEVEFWKGSSTSTSTTATVIGGGNKKNAKTATPSSGKVGYVSVSKHFYDTYRIVTDASLPVVKVGSPKNPSYLPLEVCRVVAGQPAAAKLDPEQTQKMIGFAVRPPHQNASSIAGDGLKAAGLTSENVLLGQFGFSPATGLITVPGRVLFTPTLMYLRREEVPRFGSWNLSQSKFIEGKRLGQWSSLQILSLETPPSNNPVGHKHSELLEQFYTVMGASGIDLPKASERQDWDLNGAGDPQLDPIFAAQVEKGRQLLLVIMPDVNTALYNRIKYLGDVKYGIHTVCMVGSKVVKHGKQNKLDQYLGNISLKVNLKLGGRNHGVKSNKSHHSCNLFAENKTMVVGIDVTHPSPGSTKTAPSVAGMVASIDGNLMQWPAVLSIQSEARQEMVSDLTAMLKSRLKFWKDKNMKFPENILVYRDGVSEGQYDTVLQEELPLLRKACQEMYPRSGPMKAKADLPRISIIIVGKRHHTRFYPTSDPGMDRSGNPNPGTVVDRGVTEARNWDFFLQAHAAIQGTARPGHYYVIHDEIFRELYGKHNMRKVADIVQDVTQNMCYSFGRATKAVSICAPAYYADLVCERARRYLSDQFDPSSDSSAASTTDDGTPQSTPLDPNRIRVHTRLQNSMFYI